MKRIRYTAAALLVGTFFIVSPVMASTSAVSEPAVSDPAPVQQVVDPQQADEEQVRKKAQEARKEIVAIVEGAEISMYDLVGMMNRVAQAYYSHVKEPTDEITLEIKQRALDRLIFEELAVKEAIRQGIKPPADKLQEVILTIKQSYETEEGYQAYLADLGITEEQLKERITRSQLLEGITGREVYQKVIRKEDVVKKAYDEYKEAGKLRRADEFVVKEILVMAGENEESTRARAAELLAELKSKDNDFGKLVLDGSFIVRRLSIAKEKYPVVFEKMTEMKVGDFSEIVEDNGTFHIFEVMKNEPARDMTEEEARGFIEDRLAPYFQELRRSEWMKELRKDAKVEVLLDELKVVKTAPEATAQE